MSEEDKGKKGGGSGDLEKVEGSDHDQQIYTECFEVKSQLKDSDLLPDLRLASQEPPEGLQLKEYFKSLSLDKKHKLYQCGTEYVTLKEIEVWSETRKSVHPFLPENLQSSPFSPAPSLDNKVSLWKGDITRLEIDAIVNSANCSLLGGGGVDGAIHSAAGSSLYEECLTLKGCDEGHAKITSGHQLPAKYILHAVSPDYVECEDGEEAGAKLKLTSCYKTCFDLVLQHNIRSVAFCCMATGVYCYPNDEAAEVALGVTREWMEKHSDKIDRIIFCVFLKRDYEIYQQKLCKFFPPVAEDSITSACDSATYEEVDQLVKLDTRQEDFVHAANNVQIQVQQLQTQAAALVHRHQTEVQRYTDTIAHKDKVLQENQLQIAELRSLVTQKDNIIKEKEAQITELHRQLKFSN